MKCCVKAKLGPEPVEKPLDHWSHALTTGDIEQTALISTESADTTKSSILETHLLHFLALFLGTLVSKKNTAFRQSVNTRRRVRAWLLTRDTIAVVGLDYFHSDKRLGRYRSDGRNGYSRRRVRECFIQICKTPQTHGQSIKDCQQLILKLLFA